MPKQIIWSPLADSDLDQILKYLYDNWNYKVSNNLLDKIELITQYIAENPKCFPLINKRNKIRKCVLTKHNSIFYREHSGAIEILRLFDVRQDPHKLKFN